MFSRILKARRISLFTRVNFSMKFKEVANIYSQIEKVNPKRTAIIEILSDYIIQKYKHKMIGDIKMFFIKLTLGKFEVYNIARTLKLEQQDEGRSAIFTHNPLSTDYQETNSAQTFLNIAENTMMNYIAKLYEKDLESIRSMYTEKGDLGEVAAECLLNTPYLMKLQPSELTVEEIIQTVYKIKTIEGKDSQAKKYHTISRILRTNNPLEVKYIIKLLLSMLRIGVSSKSLIKVLQDMEVYCDNKIEYDEFIYELERDVFGYNIRDNPDPLHLNIPVSSMLGRSAKNFSDLTKFVTLNKKLTDKRVLCEYKYDGERSQIHFDGSSVNLFSRGFEIQNFKYYELHKQLENYFKNVNAKVKNCILDGEILYKSNDGELLSFQEIEKKTTNRHHVNDKYPSVYLFDVMHLNDRSLVRDDILTRKGYLNDYFGFSNKFVEVGKSELVDLSDPTKVESKVDEAMTESMKFHCEGLFLKITDKAISIYDTSGSNRTQWIKYKGNFINKNSGMSDTLDLIPVAAFYGRGRRTGTFGSYLMATYDPEDDVYYTICKVGTGFTDSNLQEFTKKFESYVVSSKPSNVLVDPLLSPHVWLEPKYVWEISADSFTASKTYDIGNSFNISLRFPRFVREREDKDIANSTKTYQIKEMVNAVVE